MVSLKQQAKQRVNNPPAEIPLRNQHDEIDLAALGSADLETWVKGDHIVFGDLIFPIWRGMAPDGTPFDELGTVTEVPVDYDPDVGVRISINNRFVALDGGWAFYSYKVNGRDDSVPDSQRLFCYLGVRQRAGGETLPVVQARESHDREIDYSALGTEGVAFFAPAYQAMQVGDSVELVIRRFKSDGSESSEVFETFEVTEANLGQPITWQCSRSSLATIRNGRAEVHYQITLSGQGGVLTSPSQVFAITTAPAQTDYLPAVSVDGYAGGPLDPGQFPNGLTVRVPAYPGVQAGDHLLLYWQGASMHDPQARAMRMDLSSVEAEHTTFRVGADALEVGDNNLSYQFARAGQALSSATLTVEVMPGRTLDAPLIELARPDGQGRQVLEAIEAISGAYVVVPALQLAPGEKIVVHWQGHANGGVQVTDTPEPGDAQRYRIDPAVVAANMHQPRDNEGRRFEVFYQIVKDGSVQPARSPSVNLRVAPLAPNPTFACAQAEPNGDLRRSKLTSNGALLRISGVGLWSFAAIGQLLTIKIDGLPDAVLRNAQPVTLQEFSTNRVEQWLSTAMYGRLADGTQYSIRGQVSFDRGDSWHDLPVLRLTPRKSL